MNKTAPERTYHMKHVKRSIWIGVLCFLCAALLACGKETERQYEYLVTFDYNLGTEIESDASFQYLGVKSGSLLLEPGVNANFSLLPVRGYYNEGWYLPALDENGAVVTDESGRVRLGEKWDFSTGRAQSEMTLYANFLPNPTLTVVGGDEPVEYSYEPGYTRNEPTSAPESSGNTFYGYYEDADFTVPFTWPYTFTTEDKTIYARFIPGVWTIVRTPAAFRSAVNRSASADIYLDADLDFTGEAWPAVAAFDGTIEGNGHAIANIGYAITQSRIDTENFALFGTLGDGAVIRDVTFSDCDVTFAATSGARHNAALLVWRLSAGAALENVTVTGTLTDVTGNAAIVVNLFGLCAEAEEGSSIIDCDYTGVTLIPRT